MKFANNFGFLTAGLLGIALVVSGCAGEKETATTQAGTQTSASTAGQHSGWWCVEHGVPEEDCSLCSSKAAEECKAKGDWCEEHGCAESQCFKCDPSRAEKFAKLYEAKFGKKPPAMTE